VGSVECVAWSIFTSSDSTALPAAAAVPGLTPDPAEGCGTFELLADRPFARAAGGLAAGFGDDRAGSSGDEDFPPVLPARAMRFIMTVSGRPWQRQDRGASVETDAATIGRGRTNRARRARALASRQGNANRPVAGRPGGGSFR
jgi:hypothetical protein